MALLLTFPSTAFSSSALALTGVAFLVALGVGLRLLPAGGFQVLNGGIGFLVQVILSCNKTVFGGIYAGIRSQELFSSIKVSDQDRTTDNRNSRKIRLHFGYELSSPDRSHHMGGLHIELFPLHDFETDNPLRHGESLNPFPKGPTQILQL